MPGGRAAGGGAAVESGADTRHRRRGELRTGRRCPGLGGDWYDVLELRRKLVYLAVGDVVGHGLPAVEDMASCAARAALLALQGLPPAQLLAELNTFTGAPATASSPP